MSALRGALSSSRNNLYTAHLRRIFPDKDESWRNSVLSGYWRVHERNLFALFYLKSKVYADLEDNISWTGREHLDEAVAKGKGLLLLVPHFGDERSLHVILGMEEYPVDVILASCSQASDMGFSLHFTPIDPPEDRIAFPEVVGEATEKLASRYPSQYEWKNLLIRHRESNTIARMGKIPTDEYELEQLAEYTDADPSRVLTLEGILDSLS